MAYEMVHITRTQIWKSYEFNTF